MYLLDSLLMKDWYLCDLEQIHFKGSIGLIGPTGAGKTSILDAIQTVMCGASHRAVNLNPSTGVKTKRSHVDYCLGYLVPKRDGGQPVRDVAETILALTFAEERPDGTRHFVTAGVVMTARVGDSRENVETRFIAPGMRLDASDLLMEKEQLKTWEELSAELRKRCPTFREYRHDARKFVNDLLATTRRGGLQPDPARFLKNFSTAVKFESINDPTDFTRAYILDQDDLDFDRVRAELAGWKGYKETIRTIEDKIKALNTVAAAYESWGRDRLDAVSEEIRKQCAAYEYRRIEYKLAHEQLKEARAKLKDAEESSESMRRKIDAARNDLEQLQNQANQRGVADKIAALNSEEKELNRTLAEIRKSAKEVHDAFQAVATLKTVKDYLRISHAAVIAAAEHGARVVDPVNDLDWLFARRAEVETSLTRFTALSSVEECLAPQREELEGKLVDARRRRDELSALVGQGDGGSALYEKHTLRLMRLLSDAGIPSTPVCDVVEVMDESWQRAIESLLGLGREALIVPKQEIDKANDILHAHRNSDNLHLCRLVKVDRTDEVNVSSLHPRSIATKIRSSNPDALAYVVRLIGGYQMAETREELSKYDRRIMRNGQASGVHDYRVNRDNIKLILGKRARSQTAELAREELKKVIDEVAGLQSIIKAFNTAVLVAQGAVNFSKDLAELAGQYDAYMAKVRQLADRRSCVLTETDQELAGKIADCKSEIAEREKEREEFQKDLIKISSKHGALQDQVPGLLKLAKTALRARADALLACDQEEIVILAQHIRMPDGRRFWGKVNPMAGKRLMYRHRPEDGIAYFKDEEKKAGDELRALTPSILARKASAARDALYEKYCRVYMVEPPISSGTPFHLDIIWLTGVRKSLEENELREYAQKVEHSERTLALAIKEDLLTKLSDKFSKLDKQLDSLNRFLSKRIITGQIYRFGKKPDPAYDSIRRLAIAVTENPDQAQAIIEKRHEDQALVDAMTLVENYLDTEGGENLRDYRNYFWFDLYMLPKEVETQGDIADLDAVPGRMTMSGRIGTASGGESQAPYYVAMAASMSMAYFPGGHPAKGPTGMGLVLFDEAFNKLDVINTQTLVNTFADFGLQMLVAAPEVQFPIFNEVFDTIVTVSKNERAKTLYVNTTYPKEKAKKALAAINPHRKTVEDYRVNTDASSSIKAAE